MTKLVTIEWVAAPDGRARPLVGTPKKGSTHVVPEKNATRLVNEGVAKYTLPPAKKVKPKLEES